jgi:hypothetical protein
MDNKFIYICIAAYELTGVRKKIQAKIESLNDTLDEEVVCLFFCNDLENEIIENNIIYIPFKFKGVMPKIWQKRILWRFQEYYIRKKKFEIIYQKLSELKPYKGIIFRYISADLNLFKFALFNYKRIVFEHNTIEINELKLIPNKTVRSYYVISERIFGPFVRMFSKYLISVMNEVAKFERNVSWNLASSYTITNGVNIEEYPFTQIKKYDGNELHVLFSSGYANPWHGVDLLIDSIKKTQDIFLHLVGEYDPELLNSISDEERSRIFSYGKLTGDDYNIVFEKVHIAVSSLALHRIGLTESNTLKSKEYTARGIPFILGSNDIDFNDQKIKDFVLRLDVRENNLIDFEKVKKFLLTIDYNSLHTMNEFAQEKLSYSVKAKEYGVLLKKHF